MEGNILVPIALFGWIPLVLMMFAFMPARRAVIYGFLLAWLFLPMSHYPLQGFTDYNKMSAACFGVLISAMIFDSPTLFAFRPKLADIPMFIWCICPYFSSISNGLGAYDGIVSIAYQTTFWGLPYLIGRLYFNDLKGLRELATGIVVAGMVYLPLCWIEIRFSPQLHRLVYGYLQYSFDQARRADSFRPMVFMQHGLAVALWMGACTVTAFWMMRSKTISKIWDVPIALIFVLLLVTSILCHSNGATVLMFGGLGVLLLTQWTKWPIWVIALALAPPTYMVVRATNSWTGEDLVKRISLYDPRAASSLDTRLFNEHIFVDKAMQQPVFGWAGWDRFREVDEDGKKIGVPDALWVITFGHQGLVGLVSLTVVLTMPMLLLAWKIPVRFWSHPGAAPAAVLSILSGLYMCDNLMNAMNDPIFLLGVGGICGLNFSLRQSSTVVQWAQPPTSSPSLPTEPARLSA